MQWLTYRAVNAKNVGSIPIVPAKIIKSTKVKSEQSRLREISAQFQVWKSRSCSSGGVNGRLPKWLRGQFAKLLGRKVHWFDPNIFRQMPRWSSS